MKLRLHKDRIEDDLAILDACRAATGDRMEFMVDANQATNLPSASTGGAMGLPKGADNGARTGSAQGVVAGRALAAL